MIGVDYDLFWSLNPKSLAPFVKAFELKKDMELTQADVVAYRTGDYVRMAIASNFSKDAKYPTKPFGFKTKKEMDEDARMEEMKKRVMERAQIINKRFEG